MINVNGERFVVTGGSGFIGGHIVEELLRQDKSVVNFDNGLSASPYKPIFNGYKSYTYHRADIRDMFVATTIRGADVIFNEACGKCTVCRDDPWGDLTTNAYGTMRVAFCANDIGAKVVHASTGSVYGDCNNQIETNQYSPKSFYGVSKLAGEQYLRAFKEYYGLRFVGLRYFHVFGPRQDSGPNGGVVAIFATKILRGEPIQIYGDGEQARSFTYVKDVVEANFLSANSESMEGDYFNVASGVRITLNQLIESIERITGKKAIREYRTARKGDIRDFHVSNSKIAAQGMDKWTSFEDGLEETVRWYHDNSA